MNENSLRNDSISSLIAKFSIPAIIGMLVNAIYNIVDRIFIGKYVGEEALASLIVVFPILMFLFALSVLIGQGGANLVSISLGRGNRDDADRFFTNTISTNVFVGVVASALMLVFIDNILIALGAGGPILEHARTYLGIYLLFVPISTTSFCMSAIVRSEGFPKLSMNSLLASALTNIVLDYVFIAIFGWGVAGGAIATVIGQTVGFVILTAHFLTKKSTLHFHKKDIIPHLDTVKEIFTIGFPSFLSAGSVAVSMLVLNIALNKYGGKEAITAMAAINSLFTFIIMPINGIQGGVQPIIGFNHGARLRGRVKETLIKACFVAMAFSCVAFIIIQTNPKFLLSLFIDENSATMNGAIVGLRLFMLSLPVLAISILSTGYFQATQKPKVAIFLGLLRQFILLTPLLFIIPRFFGLNGVWMAVPISDFIAVTVSTILLISDFRSEDKENDEIELELDSELS